MGPGIFILLVAIFLYLLHWNNKKPKNYPKGPYCFPILGTLPQLLWHRKVTLTPRHKLFMDYSKKYGKIFALKLASYDTLIINDYKLIREAWNNPLLCGRTKTHAEAARTGGIVRGVLFQDGEEWSEQRRFALRNLRDFGFGKKSMENLVMDEVFELIDGFKRDLGKPISTHNRFNIAVVNALWTIVAGQRYSHDDKELNDVIHSITESVKSQGIVFYMPWLKNVFPKMSGWEKYVKDLEGGFNFMTNFVNGRIESFKGGEPEHFTDVYINEMRKTTDPNSSFYEDRGEKTLVGTLLDLLAAGAETTATTLTHAFLYLALFPERQKKLHDEIDRCLGSRSPTLEDKPRMPYTEAVILETLRYSSIIALGVFHKALADIDFHGYFIPKNTWVIANLYGAHHDVQVWGDPENFRPERFLSADGEEVLRNESLLAFSYGKRVCLGETLARDELFLFVTSIFQQFVVTPDPSSPMPTTEQQQSIVVSAPKPHKLVLNARN